MRFITAWKHSVSSPNPKSQSPTDEKSNFSEGFPARYWLPAFFFPQGEHERQDQPCTWPRQVRTPSLRRRALPGPSFRATGPLASVDSSPGPDPSRVRFPLRPRRGVTWCDVEQDTGRGGSGRGGRSGSRPAGHRAGGDGARGREAPSATPSFRLREPGGRWCRPRGEEQSDGAKAPVRSRLRCSEGSKQCR